MEDYDYKQLEKIIFESISKFRDKKFKLEEFTQNMEAAFKKLGFREPHSGGYTNSILLLRYDNMGDFILTTPAIREVRMNYPNAFITLVVRKKQYDLAELCPYVNEVLIYDEFVSFDDPVQTIQYSAIFSKKYLWHRHYDLAISFRSWTDDLCFIMLWLMYMSGARERVAYYDDAYPRTYMEQLFPKRVYS